MTKTLLSILIALVFVFGMAGVTVAAAQQSQPGEPFYALRTWSTQMFRQQDKTQVFEPVINTQSRIHEREMTQSEILEQAEYAIQTQSGIHEVEITQTLQSPVLLEDCSRFGTNAQCGFSQHIGAAHAIHHPDRDHGNNRTDQQNGGSNHENDGSDHQNGGSNHENDGSDHEQNDH